MKQILALAAATTLLASAASAGQAYNFTGNDLYAACKANNVGCTDFMLTMDQALPTLHGLGFTQRLVCPPATATLGQDRLIYERFAEMNPKSLNRPAVAVYLASQLEAYPCAQASQ